MLISRKHTHQISLLNGRKGILLKLVALTVLVGALVFAFTTYRQADASAAALDKAHATLQAAMAKLRANRTEENTKEVQAALNAYRALGGTESLASSLMMAAPQYSKAVGFAISPEAKNLPAAVTPGQNLVESGKNILKGTKNAFPVKTVPPNAPGSVDTKIQSVAKPGQNTLNIPGPIQNFEGLNGDGNVPIFGGRVLPPDTVGDVGPNHYVQSVNTLWQVFSKTGTALTPVLTLGSLFATLPGACANANDGDPIVLYDPLADRWLISQFCTVADPNNHQLIAISKTADPTGQYYLYDFMMPNNKFNDYPHFGVWPDGYYMSDNQFNQAGTAFLGAGAFAFERKKMLQGDPTASYVYFDVANIDPNAGGQLPTDLDGVVTPPIGAPNVFMEFRADEFGDPLDAIRPYEFHVDFATPANSTFTVRPDVALAAFDARSPASRAAIEQPAGGVSLDAIADRLMNRLTYRTLAGGVQSFVLNFTVNVSGVNPTNAATYQTGVRWTELRRTGTLAGTITVNDQGTYAPGAANGATGRNVWMGSAAQDYLGNIGVGFSASSTTLNPSILYAGRLTSDPAGQLAQGEATLQAGGGVQTDSSSRWGDYSALSVDPVDETTFWYTQEYYAVTASRDWRTRIGSFKVDTGAPAQSKGTINGTVTNCSTGQPIANVVIMTADGFFRQTDASGNFSFPVGAGTYSVMVIPPAGYSGGCTQSVTLAGGGTATVNCCLTGVPVVGAAGSALTVESCQPANGVVDPGETVTVSLSVNNTGGGDTTNLVGTLLASGGVTSPGAPQNYGVVVAGGPAVSRNFTFVVNPALTCGGIVTASLQLQDGASNLGTVTYVFQSGVLQTILTENFDGVSAPALPAGWTTSFTNGDGDCTAGGALCALGTNWATNTTTPDTGTNSAFHNDPSCVTDNLLISPTVAVSSSSAQLTFRNNFNTENTFDGGVLEIKIGAGSFTDIVTAGGSFVTGGYNGTINSGTTDFFNPLRGRMAWTGNSAGYITTTVNLPAAAAGQSIQLRWRLGSDCSVSGTGWRVDTVKITDGYVCCTGPVTCNLVCPTNITVPNTTGQCAAVVAYSAPTTSGTCGTVTCTPASGSSFAVGTTTVSCSSSTGGGACMFTVTVQDTQAPTIACPTNQTAASANGNPVTVNFPAPTVSDNCPGVGAPNCVPASGSSFPVGTTTVTCTVSDASPNSLDGTCSFTVTVTTCAITCPSNQTANTAAGTCAANVNYPAPTTTGTCGTVTCSPASGSSFAKGVTTVTCSVAGGPSCSFTVTVTDNIPPTITCPANQVATSTGSPVTVNYPAPTVSDNCPGVGSPTCVPASGSSFPIGVTTVTCTVSDAVPLTSTCTFTVTVTTFTPVPTASLFDPLACAGPGDKINGSFGVPNTTASPQTGTVTTALPPQIIGLAGMCSANFGSCTVSATTVSWSGTIPANQTLAVSYMAQVADGVVNGTYCATTTAVFNAVTGTVQACLTVNCPAAGPGLPFPAASEISDQGAGSVLIYNIYTSGATSGNTQNTRINLTNSHPTRTSFVHLFFVSEGCSVADSYVCLTGNQTTSFLASDLDPGVTGYIVAVAVNAIGCPTSHNFLIGDEYVKFTTGHAANLGAEAISQIAGGLPACDGQSVTAQLDFNGIAYDQVSHVLALDNVGSKADGNDTLLILNRIGGNLGTGAGSLSSVFGIFYDDAENALSFTFNGGHQFRSSLSNNFPRITPRFETFIPAGRTGWFKLWPTTPTLWGMTGAAINFNANAASSSGAFNQGHNLHKLRLTNTANYVIPIFPPSC